MTRASSLRPLLLDFDGTLVDTRLDMAEGVNRLLASLDLPPLPVDQVMSYVGRGARSLIRRSLDAVDPQGRKGRGDNVLRSFLGHYKEVLLDNSAPYPGVLQGLQLLQEHGVPMAVVSNKPEEPLRTIMTGLKLHRFLPVVVGGDSAGVPKPDPAPLVHAATQLRVPLSTCIMVGDSDVDIQAACNAGIEGVWCCWGGVHPDRPDGPHKVASTFDEIVQLALAC